MSDPLQVIQLGLIDYQQAYRRQLEAVDEVRAGGMSQLLFCEHPAVLTLGRMTKPGTVLWPPAQLEEAGVQLVKVDRGGDVTLHAPGQLVVYPIVDLNRYGRDLHRHLRLLEDVAMAVLRRFDIKPRREPGQTGVWVGPDKLVSIGIGVKRWITYHGIGINVNTDLSLFRMIKPCGLNVEMSSISHIIGRNLDMNDVMAKVRDEFFRVYADNKGVSHGARNTA
ncbi:MAG: lipoyl(octanoyl) transferase LipB [Candidatus Omnitrophica bacterium]|nr:lipoyl(octanoyl) transferase LipB [Candidatus Omnitrophota bacterium]MCB9720718.1 lipoyl(octanoyl) transferase LipB [Candidatus Omnitrophota bacterium]